MNQMDLSIDNRHNAKYLPDKLYNILFESQLLRRRKLNIDFQQKKKDLLDKSR